MKSSRFPATIPHKILKQALRELRATGGRMGVARLLAEAEDNLEGYQHVIPAPIPPEKEKDRLETMLGTIEARLKNPPNIPEILEAYLGEESLDSADDQMALEIVRNALGLG